MDEGKGKNKSLRLLPKDLSESLGKMPPSALDMEESVLGALMLEKPALAEVKDILKPEHFYTEAHKEIFNAIMAVHSEGAPVDMRTVIQKLRATGKIELIGGAYYITELTSKVSSAANIRWHAAVVVETGLKREMIQMASQIHQEAYEDGTDAFELLDKMSAKFEFFKKHNIPENNEQRIKSFWEKALVKQKPPDEQPIIYLQDTPVCTLGNHSLLVGKKKSRKTLFIVLMMAEYLKRFPHNAEKILLFDTEQGKSDVWMLREKVHSLTGLWIPIFYMRGMSPSDRREMIAGTVNYWPVRPVFAVIDGIRDLMTNINDPDESTSLIVWLEKLTLNYNMHVINILHLNKTDNNARGHIGSELLNKAEVTIEMELDEKNGCTIVKCESSRRKPFETFAFTHDGNGLPIVVGTPVAGAIVPTDEKKRRLEDIFADGPMKYKDLIEEVRSHFGIGVNRSKSLITEFQRNGYIIKSGGARSPDTIYKLLSTTNGHHPASEPAQTSLDLQQNLKKHEEVPEDLPF